MSFSYELKIRANGRKEAEEGVIEGIQDLTGARPSLTFVERTPGAVEEESLVWLIWNGNSRSYTDLIGVAVGSFSSDGDGLSKYKLRCYINPFRIYSSDCGAP